MPMKEQLHIPKMKDYTISQVSASDIQDFHTCPRKFYLYRILRLGQLVDRDPKAPTNRGSIIHLLLEWGSTDQAQQLFKRNQVSEEQASEMLEVVTRFQKSAFMRRLQESGELKKEQAFYLQLSKDGQAPRYLKGFIDALVWQDDGTLLIVDYKTGASEKEATDYQVQADCYALAGLFMSAESVQVLMVRPEVCDTHGEPQCFTFDYAASQQEMLREKLMIAIDAMEDAQNASLDGVDVKHCKRECSIYGTLCHGSSNGEGAATC